MVQRLNDWKDLEKQRPADFVKKPFYDPVDDSITLFFADDEACREKVDRFLSVYRSFQTKQVVGCHLKDVRKILSKVEALNIGIKTSSITFGMLLLSVPWVAEGEPIRVESRRYREVVEPVFRAVGSTKLPELQFAVNRQ